MNGLPTFAAELQLGLVHDRAREFMAEANAQRLAAATTAPRGSRFASAVRLLRTVVMRPGPASSGFLPHISDYPYRS